MSKNTKKDCAEGKVCKRRALVKWVEFDVYIIQSNEDAE